MKGSDKHTMAPARTLSGVGSGNIATGNRIRAMIESRWPTAQYAGMCCCRHERGTGSDPSHWSVHAWCGAVDYFGPSHSPNDPVTIEIFNWANSSEGKAAGIQFALIDQSPGDVHVQYIPNQEGDPPCAPQIGSTCAGTHPFESGSTGGGVSAPAGAIVAATALKAAGCPEKQAINLVAIAGRESSWNPTAHTYGSGCGPGMCGQQSQTPGAVCEDSWGLWQINWCAHGDTLTGAGISRGSLVIPAMNARAAGLISGNFSSLDPWRGLENVTDSEKQAGANAVAIVYRGATSTCDPRCLQGDGSFFTAHPELCGGCLPSSAGRESLTGGGCGNCQTLCPGVGPLHFCLDKVFASGGILLATVALIFGVYLLVRSSGGQRVGQVVRPIGGLFSSLGRIGEAGRTERLAARRRTTPAGGKPIAQRAQEARIDQGMRDTAETVLENTKREGRGTGPTRIEGLGSRGRRNAQ